jgi:uncharacterized membrane protein HdeD (DUF308 family)
MIPRRPSDALDATTDPNAGLPTLAPDPTAADFEEVRRHWGWFLVLGVALCLLGSFALLVPFVATVSVMLFLGALLLISGVWQVAHAFAVRRWRGFFRYLLAGALDLVLGFLFVALPITSAVTLTLLAAAFFSVAGVMRLWAVATHRYHRWGWRLFSGLVTLALGVVLWASLPGAGLWFLGLCVGIDLVLHGAAWIAFALAVRDVSGRHVPSGGAAAAAS